MAHADRKHIGKGAQGKGDGSGAMSELKEGTLHPGSVLKNRDKQQHTKERGQDGKALQTEQYEDHAANRRP
ncbi:hypothetical protein [Shinella pollutisoli]|uniref:Uncharacterized protein n=1 Tax=Shinella pollutisoli TaxID=2250594 RepID=A0ABV7DFB5_9HYPH|nr:hypothetical protein [Shinella pollutisoli]